MLNDTCTRPSMTPSVSGRDTQMCPKVAEGVTEECQAACLQLLQAASALAATPAAAEPLAQAVHRLCVLMCPCALRDPATADADLCQAVSALAESFPAGVSANHLPAACTSWQLGCTTKLCLPSDLRMRLTARLALLQQPWALGH